MVRAVIYCRVSSEKQMSDGAGLKSQESRCRGFAKERGYKVEKVFADQAISGALQDRPAVTELVDFLIENKNSQIVIIIDDVSRLARDIQVYYTLKAVISKYGAILESPSHNFFTENPENKLIESVSVSLAEYERNKNTQRVINRMKARLEDGFWTFQGFPKCFEFKTVRGSGKVLIHSSLAQIYVEALEGYAFNRFATVVEAHKFLLDHDVKILYSKFCEVLRNPLIAGYLKYPKWGITFRKAKHDGIISLEVFQKIQTKLDNKTPKQVNTKTDLQKDFPLRGYVKCVETESKFTGGWSTNGNGVKQPYYQARVTLDQRQEKGFRSRSFHRDKVHQELE
jgi:DNA invertase Pin-like site-specific DNA recombinase